MIYLISKFHAGSCQIWALQQYGSHLDWCLFNLNAAHINPSKVDINILMLCLTVQIKKNSYSYL